MSILLFFLIMAFQEPFSSTAAIISAKQNGMSNFLINSIYLCATSVDICVGYYLGKHLQQSHLLQKIRNQLNKIQEKYQKIITKTPRKTTLFILGPILFPWSVIVLPSLGFSLLEVFMVSLPAQLLFWYLPVSLTSNLLTAYLNAEQIKYTLYILVVLSILFVSYKVKKIRN